MADPVDDFQMVTPPPEPSPPHVTIDLGAAMPGPGGRLQEGPISRADGGPLSAASASVCSWEQGASFGSDGGMSVAALSGPFPVSVAPDLGVKIAGRDAIFPVHRQVCLSILGS